jgi:hypothetical protein
VTFISNTSTTSSVQNAAGVVYNPSGTGAVATNVQTKLRESVSVKDFGAVGDGTTDDTAAIQAAINAIPISGGATSHGYQLYFPPGKYLLSDTLVVGNRRVAFLGAGVQGSGSSSILYMSVTNTDFIDFTTGNSDVISVEKLQFLGQASGTGRGIVLGRTAQPCYDSRIRNCWFASIGGKAIDGVDLQGCHISDCAFDSGGTHGVSVTKGSANVIYGNRFYGMSSAGFSLVEGENNLIIANHFDLCGGANDTTAAVLINRTGAGTRGNAITGNIFRANKNDIVLNGNSGAASSNTGVNDTSISSNNSDRAERRFLLATDADNTHVTGNKINAPNQAAASLDAIEIAGVTDRAYIAGNSVSLGAAGAPLAPLYSLKLGATTANTNLGDNAFRGTSGLVNFVAGSTLSDDSAYYESGTWTPVLRFGAATTGITYTRQSGRWTRKGNEVTVECDIRLSSAGSATGIADLTGIPYAWALTMIQQINLAQVTLTGIGVGFGSVVTSALALYPLNNGSFGSQLTETAFSANSEINFRFSFHI